MLFNLYLLTTGASIAMNVSRSLNAKARLENTNDEVIKKYNNLTTSEKVLSNLGNTFKTLCPIYNIIHSIKNVKTDKEELCQKWKKKTLGTTIYIKASADVKNNQTQDNTPALPKRKLENENKQAQDNKQPLPSRKQAQNNTPALPKRKQSQNKTQEQNNTPAKPSKAAQYLYSVWVDEYNKYNALLQSGTASVEKINEQGAKVRIACDKYYQAMGIKNNTQEVKNTSMSRKLV